MKPMKKKVLIIVGIIAVAVIALLIFKPFSKKTAEYTFDTVKVEKGNIANTVTATGTIEAITTVEVGTQVSGIIEHVYVDFNDNVKQGQVLARLDETALRAQLKHRARLQSIRHRLSLIMRKLHITGLRFFLTRTLLPRPTMTRRSITTRMPKHP